MDAGTDAELLIRVAEGDRGEAVGDLYDRHGPSVWGAAMRAVEDPRVAEAVTIGVFQWLSLHAARLAMSGAPLERLLRTEALHIGLKMQRSAMAPSEDGRPALVRPVLASKSG